MLRKDALAWVFAGLLSVVLSARADSPPQGLPVFVNVTRQAGISFVHSFGDEKLSSILESTGAGCAFLDYDGDGDMDLYVVNGACLPGVSDPYPEGRDPRKELFHHLFRNNGDGTFTDVTEKAGVGDRSYGMGVVAADYDNDGHPDLFLASYGPNVLYHNNGDGTFTDVTEKAGVAGPQMLNGFTKWSVHAAFLDYDRDGYLDLYVANYLAFDPAYRLYFAADAFPGPLDYRGQPDLLYRNNGDGTFTDVTERAGVHNPEGRAMSVACGDFDGDGDADVFVSNDAMPNSLYRNNGGGTFTDVAPEKGVAFGEFGEATSAMGPEFGDMDNDGDLDLFVPDLGYSCLYRNGGETFEDVTAAAGIARVCGQYSSWGPLLFDYDNDGHRDIFITNGDAHHLYAEEGLLFRNRGGWLFEDVSLKSGDYFAREEYVGRGAAAGDYDNDGDVDVFVVNLSGPAVLLRNDGGNRNHWLTVKLVGGARPHPPPAPSLSVYGEGGGKKGLSPKTGEGEVRLSNRDGIGARIRVVAGALRQVAEVRAGSGYLSCGDPRAHFGLGREGRVDTLEVRWPSGVVQTIRDVRADQILTVEEPGR